MAYFLTIAIPTYNRGVFIERQLKSIFSCLSNHGAEIEVLVCDNASSDNTQCVVDKYKATNQNLTYFRQESNIGLDGNIYTCYERAQGAFVWFLSDDDQLMPSAIETVFDQLKSRNDASVTLFSFVNPNETIPESHGIKCHHSFSSQAAVEDFFKVIMISTLVLKKYNFDMSYLKALTPTIFPQITLSLLMLQREFCLIASSQPIVFREPGFVTKNFFELYCLMPRSAIKNAAWKSEEKKLLNFASKSLKQFIRLQLMERIGYYKSKSGLPWGSVKSAINEFGFSPINLPLILGIFLISKMPRQLATNLYLLVVFIKTLSVEKTISKYEKLKSHRCENIDFAKNADV
jgi:glycosyltransferase involved in cell wall biosynthesis